MVGSFDKPWYHDGKKKSTVSKRQGAINGSSCPDHLHLPSCLKIVRHKKQFFSCNGGLLSSIMAKSFIVFTIATLIPMAYSVPSTFPKGDSLFFIHSYLTITGLKIFYLYRPIHVWVVSMQRNCILTPCIVHMLSQTSWYLFDDCLLTPTINLFATQIFFSPFSSKFGDFS